ncbi:MAG TPA: Ig-like domain-containing protein, partial [Gemmatimonadaceae bacterium]
MMHLHAQHRFTLPGKHWATLAYRLGRIALATLLLALPACSKDSSTGPHQAGPPSKVVIVSGDAQSGVVGQELGTALVVRVVDANGTPVQGQAVNFHVTAGGGSVFAGSSNTNADGVAQERWTLGTVAGADQ